MCFNALRVILIYVFKNFYLRIYDLFRGEIDQNACQSLGKEKKTLLDLKHFCSEM